MTDAQNMPSRKRLSSTSRLVGLGVAALISATTVGIGAQRTVDTPQLITEEFDPLPFREDLLLIEPTFPPPPLRELAVETEPDVVESADVVDVDILESVDVFESADMFESAGVFESVDVFESADVFESGPDAPDGAGSARDSEGVLVYRVQVVALSSEASAAVLSGELELALGVAVVFESQAHLFAVRAGEFDTFEEAEALRLRIVAMKSDYGDAFVYTQRQRPEAQSDLPEASMPATRPYDEAEGIAPPEPPEMVETHGWRVLINQFLSQKEADALKRKAMKRLNRSDIEIEFKPPFYRVLVGSYRTKVQAQEATNRLKNRGYSRSLKVRAVVFLPKE